MKYLLLFAFLIAAWWVLSKRQNSQKTDASAPRDAAPEKMVTCSYCGVHLPESERVMGGDQVFCCEAHRSAAGSSKS